MYGVLFQASDKRQKRPGISWFPTQCVVVITYRSLGTTYVGKELPLYAA